MALFDVKAFEAEADVLGKIRTVHFNGQGNLMIAGVTLVETRQILGMLATGVTVEGFESTQQHGYAPAPQSGPPQVTHPEESATEPQAAAPAKAKGKGRGKAKPKPEAEPEAAGNGADDPSNVVDLDDARPPPEGDLVAQAASRTKLKDVILVLRDAGFDDVDKLVAECLRIKDQVPALAKITNMEDRVKRVWERVSA